MMTDYGLEERRRGQRPDVPDQKKSRNADVAALAQARAAVEQQESQLISAEIANIGQLLTEQIIGWAKLTLATKVAMYRNRPVVNKAQSFKEWFHANPDAGTEHAMKVSSDTLRLLPECEQFMNYITSVASLHRIVINVNESLVAITLFDMYSVRLYGPPPTHVVHPPVQDKYRIYLNCE